MFLRILIWLALLVAGWMFLRPRDKAALRGRPSNARDTRASRRVAPPQAMVDCAHCGLHLPASEAVLDDAGRAFCGAAHRVAGPRGVR